VHSGELLSFAVRARFNRRMKRKKLHSALKAAYKDPLTKGSLFEKFVRGLARKRSALRVQETKDRPTCPFPPFWPRSACRRLLVNPGLRRCWKSVSVSTVHLQVLMNEDLKSMAAQVKREKEQENSLQEDYELLDRTALLKLHDPASVELLTRSKYESGDWAPNEDFPSRRDKDLFWVLTRTSEARRVQDDKCMQLCFVYSPRLENRESPNILQNLGTDSAEAGTPQPTPKRPSSTQ
jgi:hypothetical protein